MGTSRDKVLLSSRERLDLPDAEAIQDNARTDLRASLATLLVGASPATHVLSRWLVEQESTPTFTAKVTRGRALGAELRDDPGGTVEHGVPFGSEVGSSVLHPSFFGLSAATYGIYVRFVHAAGVNGARRFYNPGTGVEVTQATDTRLVAGWEAAVSASSPGDEYHKIADVDWDGVAVVTADITPTASMFFEGVEGDSFGDVWGDGGNDRNADRAQYGITDLYTWVHAVRRQLADVLGAAWYAAAPTDLTTLQAHQTDSSDPHGSTLTQTNLVVTGTAAFGNRPTATTDSIIKTVDHHAWRMDPGTSDIPGWRAKGASADNVLGFTTLNDGSNPAYLPVSELCGRGGTFTIVSIELYVFHEHADLDATIVWEVEKRSIMDPSAAYTSIASGTIGASVTSTSTPTGVFLSGVGSTIGSTETCRVSIAFINGANDRLLLGDTRITHTTAEI